MIYDANFPSGQNSLERQQYLKLGVLVIAATIWIVFIACSSKIVERVHMNISTRSPATINVHSLQL